MVKIKGDDLHKVADFAEGFGKTVQPIGDAAHNLLTGISNPILHGFSRKARIVEFKEAEYIDAVDWTVGDDGSVTVHASVEDGGTTVDLPEPIEFIHFGKVYRDDSHRFAATKIDDTKTGDALSQQQGGSPVDIPAHGLMYRAALMRETILLGGFIRAQMDALIAEEKSKGVVGLLAQIFADMTGSAGATADKPSPVDLNPHIKKVIEAGKKVNVKKVDYPTLHAAGIELHTARKAYREYLVAELDKRQAPALKAKTPTPGGGVINEQVPHVNKALEEGYKWWEAKDLVPKLTMIVPPGVQDFLSMVQKISFKAWDVYASLIYEYSIRLEPIIETACADISVNAIQKRATPMFAVWNMEPQKFPDIPQDIDTQIFGLLDNPVPKDALPGILSGVTDAINKALDVVTDPVKGAVQDYDAKVGIDKTIDFLARPDAYTPGRPYLDDIFLIPPDDGLANLPEGDRRARRGWSSGLGDLAVTCMKGALGLEHMPAFIEWTVSKVATVAAEFVRGIYCRLLTLKDTDNITEAEMIEAAERHLIGNVVESVLGGLKFVDKIRKEALDFPLGHVSLSIDALVGRAKEFAAQKLHEFVAPVIKFAVRDLYQVVFAYRSTAIQHKAMTMEVHLAELPVLFARLFRNVFFPLWDKVLEKVLSSVTASLMPKVQEAAQKIVQATEQVDKIRTKILKGIAALESLPKNLPDVGFDIKHPKDSIDKIKKDWNPIVDNAKKAWDGASLKDAGPAPSDQLEASFPLPGRIAEAEAETVTEVHLKKVLPAVKWKGTAKLKALEAAASDGATNGAAENTMENGKASSGKQLPMVEIPDAPSSKKQQSLMMPFDYADLPPALPAVQSLANGLNVPGLNIPGLGNSSSASAPPELTQQFQLPGNPSASSIDPEETVDLPGSAMSVLLPFLGSKKS